MRDLEIPGRRLSALWATPDGHRLVTFEGPTPPGRGRRDEYQVNLYDPEQIDRPIATLERWEAVQGPGQPQGRAFDFPLVAIAPDGKSVAVARGRVRVVSLWSTDDGQALGTIEARRRSPTCRRWRWGPTTCWRPPGAAASGCGTSRR